MSDADESDGPLDLEVLKRRYHFLVLGVLVVFMLWVRLRSYGAFIRDGRVFFSGNDAWYHLRQVNYTVRNWPFTMPFDPWTQFPYGTYAGQFGTLYDQLVATAALILGLGSPSDFLVRQTLLVAPAVFGALAALTTYYIAARLGGRRSGLFAVVLLALFPGTFLQRTLVGFADHNSIEPLVQGIAIAATMVALAVAESEVPVYEQVLDRDWDGLRRPVAFGLLAGVAVALYVIVWPPALFLLGVLGIFYAIALSYDYVHGRSPEHVASVGASSMAMVFFVSLLWLDTTGFGVTDISILHLVLSAGVGIWCIFLAFLARVWERRALQVRAYPLAVLVVMLAGVVTVRLVDPALFASVARNAAEIFAFGQTDTTRTIAEAQAVPFGALGSFLVTQYGFTFATGLAGFFWLAFDVYRSEEYSAEQVLVLVWAVATTMMALTQVRFNYYLAPVVAVLSGLLITRVLAWIELDDLEDVRGVETFQVLVVLVLVLVTVGSLVPPIANTSVAAEGTRAGPASVVDWADGLDWLRTNSPPEGTYGGADNPMELYGTYDYTGDYSYPEGAYGVMSWWDYGHWITVIGERIPNANPFQGNARQASAFLLATNETRANLLLDAYPTDSNAYTHSTDELRSIVADQSAQEASEDTRYVVIDDQMAGGKFTAVATWTGPGRETYFSGTSYRVGGQNATLVATNQEYRSTMLSRLYYDDASGLAHYRLVHEIDRYSLVGGHASVRGGRLGVERVLRRIPLNGDWQSIADMANQIQGANRANQAVSIGGGSYIYEGEVESRVKVYERVEGATVTGSAPEVESGTPAFVLLELRTNTGRNFTYFQNTQVGPDGSFAFTVPYATDDAVSPAAGGTNSSVRAQGEYRVVVGNPFSPIANGTAQVPEEALYQGREIPVELEMTSQGSESSGDGSSTDQSGGNQSTTSGNASAESIAVGRERPRAATEP